MSRRFATVSRTRVRNSSVVQMFPGVVEETMAIFIEQHLNARIKVALRPQRAKGRQDRISKRRFVCSFPSNPISLENLSAWNEARIRAFVRRRTQGRRR